MTGRGSIFTLPESICMRSRTFSHASYVGISSFVVTGGCPVTSHVKTSKTLMGNS